MGTCGGWRTCGVAGMKKNFDIGGLLGNPLFMMGTGLLSNQQNQMGGALSGLAAAQGYKLSEAKMKKEEEQEARLKELQDMQMAAAKQAQERQQYTQALLTAGSSQNPALLQDPAFQSQLRMKAAAYGDPAALQAGGLLAPLPTSTELPADARLWEWAKGDKERMEFLQRGNQQQAPSNVQEWQYFNSLSPEDQQRFLAMKRSGQMFDVGGVPNVLTPSGSTTPLATPEDVARNRGQQAAATAAGTAAGEAQAAAPGKVASIDDALTAVQGIKDDPAIKNAYGVVAGRAPTLRQDTQDFEAKRDQVVEAISLAERGELKGTGPITDFEQKMLRSAKTILQNKLIGPELAQAEVNRVYEWLSAKRAAAAKIVPGSSPSQRARLKYNPATGEFE